MTQLDRTLAKSLHCQLGNLCSTTQRSKNRKNIAILASSLDLGNTTYYLVNKVTREIEFLLWILLVPGYMCNLGGLMGRREKRESNFFIFLKALCISVQLSHIVPVTQSKHKSLVPHTLIIQKDYLKDLTYDLIRDRMRIFKTR